MNAIAPKGYKLVGQKPDHTSAEPSTKNSEDMDLLIIGAGSAGFAAAIRVTELGASVTMVERGAVGGTCVNFGCVPSKTLIRAAGVQHRSGHHAFVGINTISKPPDFKALIEQKRQLVSELQQTKYFDVLASYPDIKLIKGHASFRADGKVQVDGKLLRTSKVLITTGSSAWLPAIAGLAETDVLTSKELMELESLPKHLVVIGGGYVGLELGQTFARLGSQVTVLARSRLTSREDEDISRALATYLRQEGIDVRTAVRMERVSGTHGVFRVEFSQDEGSHIMEADEIFVAAGRRSNTGGMGLEEVGIALGNKGQVLVDEHLATNVPNVYAAGDVIGDPAFVYLAAYAGALAAENAMEGNLRTYDISVVPRVTFTDPAVAAVGLTEAQARAQGMDVAVSHLPMSYVPRAIAARDTRGFIKLIANKDTGLLVGAHILAPEAGEMIEQAVMAIRFGIRIDEIASMLHPYLTNSEGIKLACQAFNKDITKLSCCAA